MLHLICLKLTYLDQNQIICCPPGRGLQCLSRTHCFLLMCFTGLLPVIICSVSSSLPRGSSAVRCLLWVCWRWQRRLHVWTVSSRGMLMRSLYTLLFTAGTFFLFSLYETWPLWSVCCRTIIVNGSSRFVPLGGGMWIQIEAQSGLLSNMTTTKGLSDVLFIYLVLERRSCP